MGVTKADGPRFTFKCKNMRSKFICNKYNEIRAFRLIYFHFKFDFVQQDKVYTD